MSAAERDAWRERRDAARPGACPAVDNELELLFEALPARCRVGGKPASYTDGRHYQHWPDCEAPE